jgi:hypothetical protein
LAGLFLVSGYAGDYFTTPLNVTLSNPSGLINLAGSPGRAPGLPQAAFDSICALAASRRRTHIPVIDSTDESGRPGAAIWKASLGTLRWLRQENITWPPSGFLWGYRTPVPCCK